MPTVEAVKHNHQTVIAELQFTLLTLQVLGPGVEDNLLPDYVNLANAWGEIQHDMQELMEYLHQ